jgi:tripartite-type tricarboxylate transporter receptor subunit TctC
MKPGHFTAAALLLLVAAALVPSLAAAAWPERPIRVIIPWPPEGSTDIIGRIVAADLGARVRQQVLIDNRAGAGSIVGLQIATASPPDGYTFMMTSTAYGFLIDNPKVPVDLVKPFAPVMLIGFGESALVVRPSFPVKTVKDLIDLAKSRTGEILYSSSGIGGFPHMNTALFTLKTGAKMAHVPFKGGAAAKMSSAEFGRLVVSGQDKWLEVIRVAGIKGE